MAAAPPDYKDLFTPGSDPTGTSGTLPPSAPPPAGAPYPPQAQQYPPQGPPQAQPYPAGAQPAAYPPPAMSGQQVPYQGYPAPSYPPQANTTVVVNQQQSQTTVINQKKSKPNHVLHCVICFFCPWYFWIWLIICCIYGC